MNKIQEQRQQNLKFTHGEMEQASERERETSPVSATWFSRNAVSIVAGGGGGRGGRGDGEYGGVFVDPISEV
ncbi:hypothetical protein L6164_031288 [Bauhinia variegata]|uniref:Uncharacterized protein n=1 Tax=Bauhinia variegata TaxID=167791 RepID=A0ACB9LGB4_BAUVA|nr:hypothetical protein L6164_031288 [Bauhinia variegata]